MIAVSRLAVILLSFALVGASDLTAADRDASSMTPGVTYTMHYVSTPAGGGAMGAAMDAQRANWTGTTIYAAGRGRLDITNGGQAGLYQQGDWLLFDREDFLIVHPAAKTFTRLPSKLTDPGSVMAAAGVKMTITNIAVSFDTLGGSDTLDGHPTRHYRLTAAYTLTMDMSGMNPGGIL